MQVSVNVNKPHYASHLLGSCHTHEVNTELPAKILLGLLQLDQATTALNLTGSVAKGDENKDVQFAHCRVIYGEKVG